MPVFGKRSLANLANVNPRLVAICNRAVEVYDFSVIEGHRTVERQLELFEQGKSKIDGISKKGMHNYDPSMAVDLLPYPSTLHNVNVWNDEFRFHLLAGVMFTCAYQLGERIRWGGDWNGDGSRADQTFHDLPHFELIDFDPTVVA